ncbi:putative thiopurine S-methyltransferase [Neosynchiropus ocellatus]
MSKAVEPQANRVMDLGEWNQFWHDDQVGFHMPEVHRMLKKYLDQLLAGRTKVRFFFPLCGKAVDMKWLADMGHPVVGVEISEKAVRQFFEENNLPYTEEAVPAIPGAKVFKNSEKNISLYQCDLYDFTSSIEGQFGAIWDRGSMVAINPKDREKYAALMMSLMADDCAFLLDTLIYDSALYEGPPFLVPDEQVQALFGGRCDIKCLQSEDIMSDLWKSLGLESIVEHVILITPKRS